MSASSAVEAERITRLLDAAPGSLDFLERLDAASLQSLRSQIVEVVFDVDAGRLGSLRAAARLLPPPVSATVVERALGPVLCAHLAGSLDDATAAAIARRLSPGFLAEVAAHVHPARVEAVVGRLPAHRIEAAADVLVARGDRLALGHFAGIIDADALRSVADRLDPGTILDVARFVEPIERVDHIVGLIDDPVLLSVLGTANAERRWSDAFDLVDCLGTGTRVRIARMTVPRAELIDGAVRAAAELDRWPALLSFAVLAGDVPDHHWSAVEALADADVVVSAVDSAERNGHWDALVTLVAFWPEDLRGRVGRALDPTTRGRLGV